MAGSASGIRAGRAFIELGSSDSNLSKGLNKALRQVRAFGNAVRQIGRSMSGFGGSLGRLGTAALAPFGAASKTFADFDSAMASLRANANPTAKELEEVNAAVMEISKATGFGPAKVAAAMTELLKAGLPLRTVLQGAATAAIQFAKVAEMEVPEAATTLTDAMNVFGVDATTAVDTMSKAADASSISVRDVALSFSMASAVAKLANQNITDTANAIALLGQNGLKGSDAGTSLKTMLLRLMAPAEEGAKAIARLHINVRDANQQMKPLAGIIAELETKLSGLNEAEKADALKDIFGTDAIRAGAILIGKGTRGWDEFSKKIAEGLPIGRKFAVLMDTLSGVAEKALAALQRLAITVGGALQPALAKLTDVFTDFANAVEIAVKANPALVTDFVKMAAGAAAAGAALMAVGSSLSTISIAVLALQSPLGLVAAAAAGLGYAFVAFSEDGKKAVNDFIPTIVSMKGIALDTFAGIADALKAGDLALAGKIFWAGLKVEWLKGTDYLMSTWDGFQVFIGDVVDNMRFAIIKGFFDAGAAVEKAWTATMDAITGSFSSAVSFMVANFVRNIAPLTDVLAAVFGVDVQSAVKGAMENLGLDDSDEEKKVRAKQAADRQAAVEDRRQQVMAGLDEEQQTRRDARRSGGIIGHREREQGIAEATSDLDTLTNEAARRAARARGAAVPAEGKPAEKPAEKSPAEVISPDMQDQLDRGINQAARKADVSGTFSVAAAGQLGAATSLTSLMEKGNEESKKQTKELEKLNKKADQGGLAIQGD